MWNEMNLKKLEQCKMCLRGSAAFCRIGVCVPMENQAT